MKHLIFKVSLTDTDGTATITTNIAGKPTKKVVHLHVPENKINSIFAALYETLIPYHKK